MKSQTLYMAMLATIAILANPALAKDKSPQELSFSRILFLTSQPYSGDLVGEAESLLGMPFDDGLEAADAICQYHASMVGLDGEFAAILSTSTVNAAARLPGVIGPYRSVNGIPIAANFTALFGTTDGAELAGADLPAVWLNKTPDVNELGGERVSGNPEGNAWTGTRAIGRQDRAGPGPGGGTPLPAYSFCNDWTDDSQPASAGCHPADGDRQPCGLTGNTFTRTPLWIADEYASCNNRRRLYCVEL